MSPGPGMTAIHFLRAKSNFHEFGRLDLLGFVDTKNRFDKLNFKI